MEAAIGSRVLGGIEETSLEEVLNSLRAAFDQDDPSEKGRARSAKLTHMEALDQVIFKHLRATLATTLSISGRSLPLVYKMISTIISPPHQMTVLVIDLESRFEATRLHCAETDLRHVYVHRPARMSNTSNSNEDATAATSTEQLRELVAEAENFMIYGPAALPQASGTRQWWGTMVIGGLGAGDVTAGWKGWLRVDREQLRGFPFGVSAEEALERRDQRQAIVEAATWTASSPWGEFNFQDH